MSRFRREDFGAGITLDRLGRPTLNLDPLGPNHLDVNGVLKTNVKDGLGVVSGSPFGLAPMVDGKSLMVKDGMMESRPPASYVRNDSRKMPGRSLKDALDTADARFRGSEIVGTAFPAAFDGRTYYRSDLGEVFWYSGSRAKWVSMATFVYECSSAAGLVNAYFNFPGGLVMSATMGWAVPYDMILVEAHATKNDAVNDPTFEVRSGGSAVSSLQIGAANRQGSSLGLNVAFASGALLSFFLNGTMLLGGGMRAIMRRTAT